MIAMIASKPDGMRGLSKKKDTTIHMLVDTHSFWSKTISDPTMFRDSNKNAKRLSGKMHKEEKGILSDVGFCLYLVSI